MDETSVVIGFGHESTQFLFRRTLELLTGGGETRKVVRLWQYPRSQNRDLHPPTKTCPWDPGAWGTQS